MTAAVRTLGAEPPRVAVIGTGIAGAACASALLGAGLDVTAFDKSRGVGGRMATRRAEVADAQGVAQPVRFDHGTGPFASAQPRFAAAVDRLVAQGAAARWRQRVYASFPAAKSRDVVVPVPDMPAICRQLLVGVPLRLGQAVTALDRDEAGWWLVLADASRDGPFDRVVVAIPAPQAARLLQGCDDAWAAALARVPMDPCWTLMAVTDDQDWPWDAADVAHGELAWIARGDRAPGRDRGAVAPWVAHASADWSRVHLEDDPADVRDALLAALRRSLGAPADLHWHHAAVHRWRYARRSTEPSSRFDRTHLIGPDSGLGVCGDAFGDGVEAAWGSGDDLATALIASLAEGPAAAVRTTAADAAAPRAAAPAEAVATLAVAATAEPVVARPTPTPTGTASMPIPAPPAAVSPSKATVATAPSPAARAHRRAAATPRPTAPAGDPARSQSDAHP